MATRNLCDGLHLMFTGFVQADPTGAGLPVGARSHGPGPAAAAAWVNVEPGAVRRIQAAQSTMAQATQHAGSV